MSCLKYSFKALWKRKLQNKFKNLNRPERGKSLGLIDESPPTKKPKLIDDFLPPTHSQQEEYSRNKLKLKQLYESEKWILTSIQSLV